MLKKFYHEVEKLANTDDIKINCFELRSQAKGSYMEESIIISRHSIQSIIDMLESPDYISRRTETILKNKFDEIKLFYGGPDDNPVMQLGNLRNHITGNDDDISGPVAIPLDAWGKEDYKYINPLINDLKKYITQ